MLDMLFKYQPISMAKSAFSVLRKSLGHRPKIVISDYELPAISGLYLSIKKEEMKASDGTFGLISSLSKKEVKATPFHWRMIDLFIQEPLVTKNLKQLESHILQKH